MAAKGKRGGRPPRPRKLERGTDYRSPGGNLSYYRQGGHRQASAGGYTAARSGGTATIAGPSGNQVSASLPKSTYHRYVLAEFIACLAMIAGGMILVPAQGGGTAGRSFAKQLVQLTALCVVFFMLALAGSGPKTGKVAAAFGGLVTLGVAWNLSEMWGALAKALGAHAQASVAAEPPPKQPGEA